MYTYFFFLNLLDILNKIKTYFGELNLEINDLLHVVLRGGSVCAQQLPHVHQDLL